REEDGEDLVDALDVVPHVRERGAARRGLAARGLVLADLEGELGRAVEEAMRGEALLPDLLREVRELRGKRGDRWLDSAGIAAEEPCLDEVIAGFGVGPRVDRLIEIGIEFAREGLRALPIDMRFEPGRARA